MGELGNEDMDELSNGYIGIDTIEVYSIYDIGNGHTIYE